MHISHLINFILVLYTSIMLFYVNLPIQVFYIILIEYPQDKVHNVSQKISKQINQYNK